jgi:hypothetical protein
MAEMRLLRHAPSHRRAWLSPAGYLGALGFQRGHYLSQLCHHWHPPVPGRARDREHGRGRRRRDAAGGQPARARRRRPRVHRRPRTTKVPTWSRTFAYGNRALRRFTRPELGHQRCGAIDDPGRRHPRHHRVCPRQGGILAHFPERALPSAPTFTSSRDGPEAARHLRTSQDQQPCLSCDADLLETCCRGCSHR